MPLIGAHMSIADGPGKALSRGSDAGCKVIQMFTGNRLRWVARALSTSEVEKFRIQRIDTSVFPIAIHGSYLINLASPFREKRERSLTLLLKEIQWAIRLGVPYIVLHPGSHLGLGGGQAIKLIAEMLDMAMMDTNECGVNILLETTAGQGTSLGFRFKHFADIFDLVRFDERLGVCLDTCHVFASGYDFTKKKIYRQLIKEFDTIIGLKRLKLFHINDSRTVRGSRIDRHEHPGKGQIGLRPLSYFLRDPAFKEHSFILETPRGVDENGIDMDIVNIRLLNGIIEGESR